MANGIEDLNTDFLPDGTGEGIVDILKQKAYEQVTNFFNEKNIPVTPNDTKRIVEDGLLQGDMSVILDVANEKRKDLPGSAKQQIVNELISQAAMLTTPVGQLNAFNAAIQGGGETAQMALDLGQRGVEYLGDKVEDSKFDFLNIPSTALDLTGSGLGLMDKGIKRIQSGSGAITRGANDLTSAAIYRPAYQLTNFFGQKIIDPLANKIDPFFNRFNQIRPVFKPKPQRDPVQLTNDQINQIIQDEENLTNPPVVINQPQPQQDFPIINQGGGNDQGGGGNQGGGGTVVGFAPPSTNVQQETQRISNIMDRRRRGSSQGFNSGGLATISRYLKGR